MSRKSRAKPPSPFLRFNSSPEVIRLVVMMNVRFPLSLRNVEDLLFERGIDICHETVRMWWNRFGPMFAGDIRRRRFGKRSGRRIGMPRAQERARKLKSYQSTTGPLQPLSSA
jgi:putative transposase